MSSEPPLNPRGWNSLETDDRFPNWAGWPGAVLLNDEIEYYANHPRYRLISPFERRLLKPARYQLRLGDQARINGEDIRVTEDKPLIIPKHQVAIVRTLEELNIPRFLIARWNLRVDRVYQGLLWVGALQVDPGWVGYLPCPLYNMSNEDVVLKPGDQLFTIDFVRTTPFDRTRGCIAYAQEDFSVNPPLKMFDRKELRSGPYQALKQLGELREFRSFAGALFALMFAILGIIVAAMGVLATRPSNEAAAAAAASIPTWWPTTALSCSIGALVISFANLFFTWNRTKKF